MTEEEAKTALWNHAKAFVDTQKISCPETIYQCDWVIENAFEFIEGCCDLVGYHDDEDGDE